MSLLDQHNDLCKQILTGRLDNSITDAEDDRLSEECANIWYELTDEERELARKYVSQYLKMCNKP